MRQLGSSAVTSSLQKLVGRQIKIKTKIRRGTYALMQIKDSAVRRFANGRIRLANRIGPSRDVGTKKRWALVRFANQPSEPHIAATCPVTFGRLHVRSASGPCARTVHHEGARHGRCADRAGCKPCHSRRRRLQIRLAKARSFLVGAKCFHQERENVISSDRAAFTLRQASLE